MVDERQFEPGISVLYNFSGGPGLALALSYLLFLSLYRPTSGSSCGNSNRHPGFTAMHGSG